MSYKFPKGKSSGNGGRFRLRLRGGRPPMDRGGKTPLFLHATSPGPTPVFTMGNPPATPSRAGKAETCLRSP